MVPPQGSMRIRLVCAAPAGFSDARVLRRGRPGVGKIQRVLVFYKQSDPPSEIRSSDDASTVVWYQKDPYSHITLPPTKERLPTWPTRLA